MIQLTFAEAEYATKKRKTRREVFPMGSVPRTHVKITWLVIRIFAPTHHSVHRRRADAEVLGNHRHPMLP
jgi:hypothetical protein